MLKICRSYGAIFVQKSACGQLRHPRVASAPGFFVTGYAPRRWSGGKRPVVRRTLGLTPRGSPGRRTARVAFRPINLSALFWRAGRRQPPGSSRRGMYRVAGLAESVKSCDVPSGLRHEARRDVAADIPIMQRATGCVQFDFAGPAAARAATLSFQAVI